MDNEFVQHAPVPALDPSSGIGRPTQEQYCEAVLVIRSVIKSIEVQEICGGDYPAVLTALDIIENRMIPGRW